MQKAAATPDKEIWGEILNAGCNTPYQASNGMRELSFLFLQIGTAFTCQLFINRALGQRLYPTNMMGLDIDTVLTEEAAQAAIDTLNRNKPQLEEAARKSNNSMLWFSFLAIPLMAYLLFGAETFQSTILTFMLCGLRFSLREGFLNEFNDSRQEYRWKMQRNQLIAQLEIALSGLKTTLTEHYVESREAYHVLLELEHDNTLNTTREQQRQVLMRVLHHYKINYTKIKERYKIAIPGQTIITNASAINATLKNETARHTFLAALEKQLEQLSEHIYLLVQPIQDKNDLLSLTCFMMNVDRSEIEAIFNRNSFKLEGNQLIMDGFMPGNDALLKTFLSSFKQVADPLRVVSDSAGNAGLAQPRLRRVVCQAPEAAAEAPAPTSEQIINIRWPRSGKIFNSLEADMPNYRRAGAVIPITSAFFPANRYFCIFEISRAEVGDKVIYSKFLEQAKYPRIGRLHEDQGILFWYEARSFNKFTYNGNVLAGREKIDYIAAAKIKLKGEGDNAICFGWSEVAPGGETLLHFIEYDHETN